MCSWSRSGHRLASASTDNTVSVWDVLTSDAVAKWRFATPIMKVQFNPRNDDMLLICPMKHAALTVMITPEGKPLLRLAP